MAGLNPEETNYFSQRRRQITDTYNLSGAQNAYQAGAAGREFQRGVGDIARSYGRMRERMPWQHGSRGTLNSGIYGKDLTDLAIDGYVRPLSNMAGRYRDQAGAYALAGQQLSHTYNAGLADLSETQRNRMPMQAVAAMIRAAGA